MSTAHARLTTVLLLALSAVPIDLTAQEARRRDGGGRREDGGRPERQAEGRRRNPGPQAERPQRQEQRADRGEARRGDDGRNERQAIRRWPDAGDAPRSGGRDEDRAVPRADTQPRWDGDGDRGRDRGRNDDRRADVWRDGRRDGPRVIPRRDNRTTVIVPRYRDYGYRVNPRRSYVLPYGYRPYGYRPGWSVNLYFGRPFGAYAYDRPTYGYYALAPGFAYGSLRIIDAPRDAHVFVDGYYAGVVDDYDGIFQRLNLEPGPHHVEIEVFPGDPPVEFDVRIVPGDTVTIRVPRYW